VPVDEGAVCRPVGIGQPWPTATAGTGPPRAAGLDAHAAGTCRFDPRDRSGMVGRSSGHSQFMRLLTRLRGTDRRLTQRLAARTGPGVHRTLSAVEECAESTKLWCGAAAVMAWAG